MNNISSVGTVQQFHSSPLYMITDEVILDVHVFHSSMSVLIFCQGVSRLIIFKNGGTFLDFQPKEITCELL